ncbi:MFS transporter [Alloalcanivorax sp. C16-2]|uniref:MFS transporter n=1 Tax=Alloalcanivorax TaxID=3020832 RepID=UPI0019311A29|nr:MFS transporter [Alloalcanivorax marinus]MBL7250440.1 MFS transporter [Alloalcanivorax marinus]
MPSNAAPATMPSWLVLMLATACGLIVANIYYSQPLVGPIAESLSLSPGAAGLIVTMTQVGYGAGLLLVVPLGDLVENRRLVIAVVLLAALALVAALFARHATTFLAAALGIGFGSVAVQILLPYAAHLAPAERRGQVVGTVMSGLMLGIMLARPVASALTQAFGWQAVFVVSAVMMVALSLVLARVMPERWPKPGPGYGGLLLSMGWLLRHTPILRRRALYQAFLFAAFSLFWTAVPLLLASPLYGFSQGGIALFGLAGVAGAVAAPIAGRLADRGFTRPATVVAMLISSAALGLTLLAEPGSTLAVAMLVTAAVVLDFGVSANVVLGQRAIYGLGDTYRGRLNGLYMATFFTGGALGSAVGGWSQAHGGWSLTATIGALLPLAALGYFLTELALGVPEPSWLEGEA